MDTLLIVHIVIPEMIVGVHLTMTKQENGILLIQKTEQNKKRFIMLVEIEKIHEIHGCDGCIFESLDSCKKLEDTIYNCHGKFIFRMVDIDVIEGGQEDLTWELTLRE